MHHALKVLLITILSLGSAAAEPYSAKKPLRVGMILALTGETSSFGVAVKNGAELALSTLTPEERARFDVVYEDDAFVPTKTISAFKNIEQRKHPDVVVLSGSGTAKALGPLIEQRRIPMLAVASDPEVVADRKYAMNFWVTPREEAALLIPEALRRGYRKIGRIATIHAFPAAIKDAFDQGNQGKVEVVLDEEFTPETRDFRAFISKARRQSGVNALLVLLNPGQLGIFCKQAREHGLTLPFFGFEFFEDPNEVRLAEGALEGGWYVNAATASKEFMRRYEARFPGAPVFAAANGHDAILLLNQAMSDGAASTEEINDFLHSAREVAGAMGTFHAAGDGTFNLPAELKVVKGMGFAAMSDT